MAKPGRSARDEAARTPTIGNAKARYRYEILERTECGIVLVGPEVKSLRQGHGSLDESYARFKNGELWLVGMHVDEYRARGYARPEPTRARKLLLHKAELRDLRATVERKGLTMVPLRLYWSERGLAKVEIALVRGRKVHDKREVARARTEKREMDRAVRRR